MSDNNDLVISASVQKLGPYRGRARDMSSTQDLACALPQLTTTSLKNDCRGLCLGEQYRCVEIALLAASRPGT